MRLVDQSAQGHALTSRKFVLSWHCNHQFLPEYWLGNQRGIVNRLHKPNVDSSVVKSLNLVNRGHTPHNYMNFRITLQKAAHHFNVISSLWWSDVCYGQPAHFAL